MKPRLSSLLFCEEPYPSSKRITWLRDSGLHTSSTVFCLSGSSRILSRNLEKVPPSAVPASPTLVTSVPCQQQMISPMVICKRFSRTTSALATLRVRRPDGDHSLRMSRLSASKSVAVICCLVKLTSLYKQRSKYEAGGSPSVDKCDGELCRATSVQVANSGKPLSVFVHTYSPSWK